jgi:type II secretory pathway component PulK
MTRQILNSRGSILIMVLWALTLLAVFAVQISAMTQNKISFLAKVERYHILRNAAKSGVLKALAIIKNEPLKNKTHNLLQRSLTLYYNLSSFRDLTFGPAQASVVSFKNGDISPFYGVSDESGRLNLNFVDRESIHKLLLQIKVATEDEADTLATAIFDWREYGESQIKGFSSDDYYESLQFPYPQKKGKYETLDELRLVEGMTQRIYNSFIDYVTIYGGEEINMNTVLWPVLIALGFSEEQAKTVEAIRRGADGVEGTVDDLLFEDRNMLVEKVSQSLGMKPEEIAAFRVLVERIAFVADGSVFRVQSRAQLVSHQEKKTITCVFDSKNDNIIYWREQ